MATSKNYLVQAWLVVVLALCFGAALAGLQIGLAERIEANKEADALGGVKDVVPGATKGEATDPVAGYAIYIARNNADLVKGWVVKASGSGYADRIELMFGLNRSADRITGIKILDQKETPNVGNKIEEPAFCDQFAAGLATSAEVTVIKAGAPGENQVLAVSGATVSSQSVCDIVNTAVKAVKEELAQRDQRIPWQVGDGDDVPVKRPPPVERPKNELHAENGVHEGKHTYYELRNAADEQVGWLIRTYGPGFEHKHNIVLAFSLDLKAERITGLWVLHEAESFTGPMVAGDAFREPFFTGELSAAQTVVVIEKPDEPPVNSVPVVTSGTESSWSVCDIVNDATEILQSKLALQAEKILEARARQTQPATRKSGSPQSPGSE